MIASANSDRDSGLGLLTPSDVHHGLAEQRVAARAAVLATAYGAHPERFPGGLPQPPACPTEVWINRPHALGNSHATPRTPALRLAHGGPFA
jgi:putative transposase